MATPIDFTRRLDERTIAEVLNLAQADEPVPAQAGERFDAAVRRLLANSPNERVVVRDAYGEIEILRPEEPPPWYSTIEGRLRVTAFFIMVASTLALSIFR